MYFRILNCVLPGLRGPLGPLAALMGPLVPRPYGRGPLLLLLSTQGQRTSVCYSNLPALVLKLVRWIRRPPHGVSGGYSAVLLCLDAAILLVS